MTDHLSLPGANALAKQIRDYWAKQGKKVKTEVITKAEMFCIRSDMINGMPRI